MLPALSGELLMAALEPSTALLPALCVLASLVALFLVRRKRRNAAPSDTSNSAAEQSAAPSTSLDEPALSPHCDARVLMPGVVLLKGALDADAQLDVLRWCLAYGVDGKRWLDGDGLNAPRQGRGRSYDAVGRVDARAGPLCEALRRAARAADGRADPLGDAAATHVLLLWYARLERGLGWHRDDGKWDGASLAPVVSLSLGCSCDFSLKQAPSDAPVVARLDSGDAILFGGPARSVMHAVANITPGTCPPALALAALGRVETARAGEFRLNLTWRHAPEISGLEAEERFHIFGGGTRQFLDAARDRGLAAARAEANERRRARRARRVERKSRIP